MTLGHRFFGVFKFNDINERISAKELMSRQAFCVSGLRVQCVCGVLSHDVLHDHVLALAREVLMVGDLEVASQFLRFNLFHLALVPVLQGRVHHVRLDFFVEILLRLVDLWR